MADRTNSTNDERERRKEEIVRELTMERIQVEPWYLDVRSEVVRPDQVQVTTKYFWSRWVPKLGPLPTCLLLRLRQYCYFNRATGEKREYCYPSQDTLAQELGIQNRKTIMDALRRLEETGFVRREKQYRYDPAGRRNVRTTDKYFILMEDPIAPEDQGQAFVLAAERMLADTTQSPAVQRIAPMSEKRTYEPAAVDKRPSMSEKRTYDAVRKTDRKKHPEESRSERNVASQPHRETTTQSTTEAWPAGPMSIGDALRTRGIPTARSPKKRLGDVLPQIAVSARKQDELLRVEDLAGQMFEQLGDSQSKAFYRVVARRFIAAGAEQLVYQTLAEVREGSRAGHLRRPAAAFTARIKELAGAHGITL